MFGIYSQTHSNSKPEITWFYLPFTTIFNVNTFFDKHIIFEISTLERLISIIKVLVLKVIRNFETEIATITNKKLNNRLHITFAIYLANLTS